MSKINMTSIGLFFLFLVLRIITAQNMCVDRRAVCINIRNCVSLIEILRGPRPLSQETLEALRNAQCGFEGNDPKVCCIQNVQPQQVTTTTTTTERVVQSNMDDPPNVMNHPNLRLLDHHICGPITQKKLLGGNKTSVLEYPWMALIAYDVGRGSEFRCGGTIISERYILTAAHCVTTLPDDILLSGVRVGEHDISKERDCDRDKNGLEILCAERYQDFGIESIHYHPEYNRRKLQNDIALIRLNGSIDFRPFNTRPICLPFGVIRPAQKKVIVTGWGATELGPRSQDLLQIRIPLMTNEQCTDVYRGTVEITYKQICAGGLDMIDSCGGDSGGPLQSPGLYSVLDVRNKARMIQYGIVSYGLKQCGTVGYPGVYTSIGYYMDWILNTIRS